MLKQNATINQKNDNVEKIKGNDDLLRLVNAKVADKLLHKSKWDQIRFIQLEHGRLQDQVNYLIINKYVYAHKCDTRY